MAGLLRTPATVAIYRTRRTWARPPQIQRLPRIFPLSRLNGARPASAAICLRLSIPSSGNCASRVLASTLPTPGTERSNSSRSRHKGVSRINSASSASRPESRFSNQRMCSSMLRCKTLGARARRFFSAVSISTNWRRRVTSASSAWACSSANGRASGRTASPKRASTSASSRSVLASLPVARAKSRTCRGLTIATAIPAAATALATGVSRPPVASTITKSAGFICLSNSRIPTSSLATEKAPPADPMNTSSATLATSIPTNRFTSSMFHPPQRGLPRLAIRDFFPLQPFGLSAIGGAATLAARRDLAPKGAPVCRSTNSDSSTKSSTYQVAEKAEFAVDFLVRVEVQDRVDGAEWAVGRFCKVFGVAFNSSAHQSQATSCGCRQQVVHPDQVISGQCKAKHPADPRRSAMACLAQPGDRFEPAEDLLDAFTLLLANQIAGMTNGPVINDSSGFARKVRGDLVIRMWQAETRLPAPSQRISFDFMRKGLVALLAFVLVLHVGFGCGIAQAAVAIVEAPCCGANCPVSSTTGNAACCQAQNSGPTAQAVSPKTSLPSFQSLAGSVRPYVMRALTRIEQACVFQYRPPAAMKLALLCSRLI